MSILSVGSLAFDDIITPYGKSGRILGGANLYIAYAVSHFYKHLRLVSTVGGDFPIAEIEDFKRRKIDVQGIEIKKDERTFYYRCAYHEDINQRETLETQLNCMEHFSPHLPESYTRGNSIVVLGNMSPETQTAVLDQLQEKPRLVILDTMNFWIDTAREALENILPRVDILCINDSEARLLTGEYSLTKAARKIMQKGVRFPIIKKGEHGALLFFGDQVFYAPALPLEEVFDPTGAGDTFIGGVAGYLAQTDNFTFENMKRAVIIGSVLSSFSIEKFGVARLKEISAQDISRRTEIFSSLSSFDIQIKA